MAELSFQSGSESPPAPVLSVFLNRLRAALPYNGISLSEKAQRKEWRWEGTGSDEASALTCSGTSELSEAKPPGATGPVTEVLPACSAGGSSATPGCSSLVLASSAESSA